MACELALHIYLKCQESGDLDKIDPCSDEFDICHRVNQYNSFYILKYAYADDFEWDIEKEIYKLESKLFRNKLMKIAENDFPDFLIRFTDEFQYIITS